MWTPIAIAALSLLPAQDAATAREAVVQAALDYAESYYQRDPARIERSVARELDKLGYTLDDDGSWKARPMRYEDLHGMIARLRDGEWVPPPGPKQVEVLDLLDQTALVKLTGAWGIDYMQLARDGAAWRIRHVLWQSAPGEIADDVAAADRAGIERALADYVDGLYQSQPELIERGVDAELVKYGYWRDDASKPYRGMALDFEGLREMAATWNASGWLQPDAPREIEVLDAMDKTACAKLTAWWGVDTMLLVRQDDGTWKVRQVMWQAHPEDA